MLTRSIKNFYEKVDNYWNVGRNPTLRLSLRPLEEKKPIFEYSNFNNTSNDLSVIGDFYETWWYDGSVEAGNTGFLGTIKLSSKGYTSKEFFDGCAKNLINEVYKFTILHGNNYEYELDIFANPEVNTDVAGNLEVNTDVAGRVIQIKTDGRDGTTSDQPTVITTLIPKEVTVDGVPYYVYTFNTDTGPGSIAFNNFSNIAISCMMIGGGGGGNSGGGGGGEVLQFPIPVNNSITVTVSSIGAGGAAGTSTSAATSGKSTQISYPTTTPPTTYKTADGGYYGAASGENGGGFGSCGGGGGGYPSNGATQGGEGQTNGGDGTITQYPFPLTDVLSSGGGGGSSSNALNCNGGDGTLPSLAGIPNYDYTQAEYIYYAAGGAGYSSNEFVPCVSFGNSGKGQGGAGGTTTGSAGGAGAVIFSIPVLSSL